ncbi:hypothetical protein FQR65_LT08807 [Abscondita terminalis]|nr:hypothetical protein FQR65_LT08807 [Abscondita terminalis]
MVACEPFYSQAAIRILAACGFYFPTTMILMYCYGSAFHVNKLRLKKTGCNTIASPEDCGGAGIEKEFFRNKGPGTHSCMSSGRYLKSGSDRSSQLCHKSIENNQWFILASDETYFAKHHESETRVVF